MSLCWPMHGKLACTYLHRAMMMPLNCRWCHIGFHNHIQRYSYHSKWCQHSLICDVFCTSLLILYDHTQAVYICTSSFALCVHLMRCLQTLAQTYKKNPKCKKCSHYCTCYTDFHFPIQILFFLLIIKQFYTTRVIICIF